MAEIDERAIGERLRSMAGELDERGRRLWAAAEARRRAGRDRGGRCGRRGSRSRRSARACGAGLGGVLEPGRVRRPGGGRKPLTETDVTLLADLERLVERVTSRGDPEQPLRWTAKSVRKLAGELRGAATRSSARRSRRCCAGSATACRRTRKTREGSAAPRPRRAVSAHQRDGRQRRCEPRPAGDRVDTKKKELVGDFKNAGREWRPKGEPRAGARARLQGQAARQGDPLRRLRHRRRQGWVNVGIDHDTAQFAVASIRGWWQHLGRAALPATRRR